MRARYLVSANQGELWAHLLDQGLADQPRFPRRRSRAAGRCTTACALEWNLEFRTGSARPPHFKSERAGRLANPFEGVQVEHQPISPSGLDGDFCHERPPSSEVASHKTQQGQTIQVFIPSTERHTHGALSLGSGFGCMIGIACLPQCQVHLVPCDRPWCAVPCSCCFGQQKRTSFPGRFEMFETASFAPAPTSMVQSQLSSAHGDVYPLYTGIQLR